MQYLHKIQGTVQQGKNRGKRLGFPTANIPLEQKIEEGVYISETQLDDRTYSSLTFIGTAETFEENLYQAETYIFSFDKTIYDKFITVNLIKKIRGSKKFSSVKKLIEQMEKDKKEAEDFFKI